MSEGGESATVTYPNGVVHTYTYDTRNRLTILSVAKSGTNLTCPLAPRTESYDIKISCADFGEQVKVEDANAGPGDEGSAAVVSPSSISLSMLY